MTEDYQNVNLKELIMMVLKKWWLVIICMMAFGFAAFWIGTNYTVPIYRAQTTLFIGKDSSVLASINVSDLKFSNELVSDYRELLSSRLITNEIITDLENDVYHEELIRNLHVFTIEDTRFMYIVYDGDTPERAAYIANAFSEVLIRQAEEIVGVQNIRIIDYAIEPMDPMNNDHKLTAIIGAVVGMFIAIIIVFIMTMMDNTVKNAKFIEETIGLPIVGNIPKFAGESRK